MLFLSDSLKDLRSITFSSPRVQPEEAYFWFQIKAHIFPILNLKILLQHVQTPCSFRDRKENMKFSGKAMNNFLCIFITSSSPGLHLESKNEATSE